MHNSSLHAVAEHHIRLHCIALHYITQHNNNDSVTTLASATLFSLYYSLTLSLHLEINRHCLTSSLHFNSLHLISPHLISSHLTSVHLISSLHDFLPFLPSSPLPFFSLPLPFSQSDSLHPPLFASLHYFS